MDKGTERPLTTEQNDAPVGGTASDGVIEDDERYLNPIQQVFFRAGVLACREMLARFVEQGGDHSTAASIRANWFPCLGQDYGPPRKISWNELTEGEYGTPEFRVKTKEEVSPTLEALPVAMAFLIHRAGVQYDEATEGLKP